MQREDFSVIYSGNIARADLLKCLLEGEGIQTFLEDEFLGRMVPYATAPGGAGAVKVLMRRVMLIKHARLLKILSRTARVTTETTKVWG
jgi:hypothetical protein